MANLNRISRCPEWYELNLAALRPREMIRAAGVFSGIFGTIVMALPRLVGATIRTGALFPQKVTVVWDVPLDEIDIPEELDEMGFTPICSFELPEFSGENVTCLLGDQNRTTFCELVFVRMEGEQNYGISFVSYFPGSQQQRIRTVLDWKVCPLDQPPSYLNQRVPGSLSTAYEAHRAWLATFPARALETTRETFFQRNHEDHEELCELYRKRRVWVEAREEDVERLLRRKRLRVEE